MRPLHRQSQPVLRCSAEGSMSFPTAPISELSFQHAQRRGSRGIHGKIANNEVLRNALPTCSPCGCGCFFKIAGSVVEGLCAARRRARLHRQRQCQISRQLRRVTAAIGREMRDRAAAEPVSHEGQAPDGPQLPLGPRRPPHQRPATISSCSCAG